MSNATAPVFECSSVTPGFIVAEIREAVEFYTKQLGFKLDFTWGEPATFAGLSMGKVQVHLVQGKVSEGKSLAYFGVDDVDAIYEFHQANGVEIIEPIANRDYEMRDYQVRDLYGNQMGFGHWVMKTTPALKIERVDVPVRLEKRLAALIEELAERKGLSIDSMLEETLLHTFEPIGDGVASPHTHAQLRLIQELKKKHGIDYDVHASYRFVE